MSTNAPRTAVAIESMEKFDIVHAYGDKMRRATGNDTPSGQVLVPVEIITESTISQHKPPTGFRHAYQPFEWNQNYPCVLSASCVEDEILRVDDGKLSPLAAGRQVGRALGGGVAGQQIYFRYEPESATASGGATRDPYDIVVTNHGLASVGVPVPIMLDIEAGSPTQDAFVLATKPLVGVGLRNNPTLRAHAAYATGIKDANTLTGWYLAHTTSLGEQLIAGASFTPGEIAYLQDDGTVGTEPGTHVVRLWRQNAATSLDYHFDVITANLPTSGPVPASTSWLSAEYDLLQDIPSGTNISLNASTATYSTLRDAGSAYLSHDATLDYASDWIVMFDGQALDQKSFTVIDADTIRVDVLIQIASDSSMVVWTQT